MGCVGAIGITVFVRIMTESKPRCVKCRGFLVVDYGFINGQTETYARCINCGWQGRVDIPAVPDQPEVEVVTTMPKRIDKCKGCGKQREIQGRGKCGSCYQAELRAEKANKEAILQQANQQAVVSGCGEASKSAQERSSDRLASQVKQGQKHSGIDALLNHPEAHTLVLQLPDDVWQSLQDHEVTAIDIVGLLHDLVNLRLVRVAA